FRYSDDNGRSWSPERYRIPVRLTSLDVTNDFGGRVQLFWGVGKPVARKGELWFGFSKIGRWLISHTESWLLFSHNLLEVNDPLAARWELLPEGDLGLRAPCGSIAEEISPTLLCDGALY